MFDQAQTSKNVVLALSPDGSLRALESDWDAPSSASRAASRTRTHQGTDNLIFGSAARPLASTKAASGTHASLLFSSPHFEKWEEETTVDRRNEEVLERKNNPICIYFFLLWKEGIGRIKKRYKENSFVAQHDMRNCAARAAAFL